MREPVAKLFVLLCFVALLMVGIAIYRDYGISFDERGQRVTGAVTVKHVIDRFVPALTLLSLSGLGTLDEYKDRDYGVAVEAPAVVLEFLFGLTDTRDIFLFRHLLTFILCLGGAYALYSLARRRFADRRIALLAVLFIVLTPRLFAESFYNSKDTVFMAAFAIALNTAIAFVLRPLPWRAVVHALATAIAIDIRVAAIVLPVATVAILGARMIKQEVPVRRSLAALSIYLAVSAVLVVALWPWLWSDPIGRFAQALGGITNFRFDHEILFMGALIRTTALPWHYLPVWISITTPPLYLMLFVAGVAATGWQLISSGRRLWKNETELQDLIFLGMFAVPVMAAVGLHSILYDGWRQLYFIYPAFLLVVLRGWHALWQAPLGGVAVAGIRRPALVAVTAFAFAATAAWMWRTHPLQNVYFNVLGGSNLIARYELDYWGLGTRQALEYILAHDPSESINVMAGNYMALATSLMILRPQDRRRLQETEDEDRPHYALTNYPRSRDPEKNVAYQANYDLFHEVKVDGEVILLVFKWEALAVRKYTPSH